MAATRDIIGAIRDRITGQRSRPRAPARSRSSWRAACSPKRSGFRSATSASNGRSRKRSSPIQIEKRYTKREIFTLYANQMYLGEGAYGVEAARARYFGKSAKDLTLDEAAMIAGHLPDVAQRAHGQHGPRQAPARVRAAAHGRRGLHHAERGRRRQRAADRARARRRSGTDSIAPYFVEEVRKELEKPLRREAALRERAVDPDRARRAACRRRPTARSTTGCAASTSGGASASPTRNVLAEGQTIDAFRHATMGSRR